MRRFEFDYDYENDDLFIYDKECKSSGSIEIGDVVLDFHKTKGLVGIEIAEATKFIGSLVSRKQFRISKKALSKLFACKVDSVAKDNFLLIRIMLLMSRDVEIPVNLSIPMINNPSPAIYAH